MSSFQKTMKEVEALCAEFNRLTNRPLRAYEPSDEPYPPANIGYAYVRNLGQQDDRRCSMGIITSPGGGVCSIHGLSGLYIGDLLRILREKMADPEWMACMTLAMKPVVEDRSHAQTGACILTDAPGEDPEDCTTHEHEEDEEDDFADEECGVCGAPTDDGEGYAGKCGNCADREYADDHCATCGDELGDDSYEGLCSDCAEHEVEKMSARGMAANPKPANLSDVDSDIDKGFPTSSVEVSIPARGGPDGAPG